MFVRPVVNNAGVVSFNTLIEALNPKRLYYFQDANFNSGAADSGSDGVAFPKVGTPVVGPAIRPAQGQSAETIGNTNYFEEGTGAGTIQGDYVTSKSVFTIAVGFDHYIGTDEWYMAFHMRDTSVSQLFSVASQYNAGTTPHNGVGVEWRNDDSTGEGLGAIGTGDNDIIPSGGNVVTVRRDGTNMSLFTNNTAKLSYTSARSSMSSYASQGFTCGEDALAAVALMRYDFCAVWDSALSDADILEYHAQWVREAG